MYVFYTGRPLNPVIEDYKKIYSTFERKPRADVDHFIVAKYFWDTYKIPFTLCQVILKKYVNHHNSKQVSEKSFLDLNKELNSTNISNISGRIHLFERFDTNQKSYLTLNDFKRILNEPDIPIELRMKIKTVLLKRKINSKSMIDLLDFFKFMDDVDFEEIKNIE